VDAAPWLISSAHERVVERWPAAVPPSLEVFTQAVREACNVRSVWDVADDVLEAWPKRG
jgi:hypothetical protein